MVVRNILAVLLTSILVGGLSLARVYQIKEESHRRIEAVQQEFQNVLAQKEQRWDEEISCLEQAKKKAEEEAQSKIEELQAQIELIKADYEKRLSAEKYYWQEQFEKFKAQEGIKIQQQVKDFLTKAQQSAARGFFLEAIKSYSKALALAPEHEESKKGLQEAESKIDKEVKVSYLANQLREVVEKLERCRWEELERLRKELEQEKQDAARLKEELQKQKKILQSQLRVEQRARLALDKAKKAIERQFSKEKKEWQKEKAGLAEEIAALEEFKQKYVRLKKEERSKLERLKKDYEAKLKQVKKQTALQIAQVQQQAQEELEQARRQWQKERQKLVAAREALETEYQQKVAYIKQQTQDEVGKRIEEEIQKRLAVEKARWQDEKAALEKSIDRLKQDYERKVKAIQTGFEAKIEQLNLQWQVRVAELKKKYQDEMKQQEELWQTRLKSIEEQAQRRIQAAEQAAKEKIQTERRLWQQRFEALQASRDSQQKTKEEVRVNLQVVDKQKEKGIGPEQSALDMLDQAIECIQREDYKKAQMLLEEAVKLNPANKRLEEVLTRVKALLAVSSSVESLP